MIRHVTRKVRITALVCAIVVVAVLPIAARTLTAPLSDKVHLEELTWVEVRSLIGAGKTTAIIPTGGVEQNGPHVVLGKHNYIVRQTAESVARKLGNALVAPVVAYVPEGDIKERKGHMAFAGTLSVPEHVFGAVLEHAARSLHAHGFTTIAFLGDSGGNQSAQESVARRLNREWEDTGARVIHVGEYYNPNANGQVAWLRTQGENDFSIGSHAGIRDTSELMAVFPPGVHADRMALNGGLYAEATGVIGDPTKASVERGHKMLALKVDAAVKQIRKAMAAGS